MGCTGSSAVKEPLDLDYQDGDMLDEMALNNSSNAHTRASIDPRRSVDRAWLDSRRPGDSRNGSITGKASRVDRVIADTRVSTDLPKLTESEVWDTCWPAWVLQYAPETGEEGLPRRVGSFQKVEKIGQGTYSSVYKAIDKTDGRVVALKKVRADAMDEDSISFLCREINILRSLDHPNIMKLLNVATTSEKATIFLVFEYLEHDLAGLCRLLGGPLTEEQTKFYVKQLLEALQYCHERGIMHRDVKCSNLLLDSDGNLKLGDFGLAIKPLHETQALTTRVITLWYRPPELLLGAIRYDTMVDMWSAGCIFAELLQGEPVLPGRTEVEQLHKIFKLCGSGGLDKLKLHTKVPYGPLLPSNDAYPRTVDTNFIHFPPDALELVEQLLSIIPSERGTAREALASPYFSNEPHPEPFSLIGIPTSHEYTVKRLAARRHSTAQGKDPLAGRRNSEALPAHEGGKGGRTSAEASHSRGLPSTKSANLSSQSHKGGVGLRSAPALNPADRNALRRQSMYNILSSNTESQIKQIDRIPKQSLVGLDEVAPMTQGNALDETIYESRLPYKRR
mmetsp:Transcript_17726/g.33895  ORF Transcript_17726/g.33895 Transcript_17726/m.33895 type:complete len:564 (-) Transcript_17726:609-2300(-)|eukprot:CAMPEP_0114246140 /NCGR_PEP_ID=MMETSP0058-20121206/12290_1 /TAXON_ID=36894 /ORGANISM="Pyramimonas parkeae, CCMP726" /LENGTH=563 /DNA_ID=CAMNT_0001359279 /DNA_START=286 /DNA_END=1977 /DNA_ORIENTATION=-